MENNKLGIDSNFKPKWNPQCLFPFSPLYLSIFFFSFQIGQLYPAIAAYRHYKMKCPQKMYWKIILLLFGRNNNPRWEKEN